MIFDNLPKENLQYFLSKIKDKLSEKVSKVEGKGLSTNDYTDQAKTKVDSLVFNCTYDPITNTITFE